MRVEVLNGDGKRVRGFSHDDAIPVTGDSLRHSIRWQAASGRLPPGSYMLRLHLTNATVYAWGFRNESTPSFGPAVGISRPTSRWQRRANTSSAFTTSPAGGASRRTSG